MGRTGRIRALAVGVGIVIAAGAVLVGQQAFADPAPPSKAALAAWAQPLVPGTPCSISASACVDLDSQQSWLIKDGKVVEGPVKIASGGKGKETPIGHSLRVYRKDRHHVSSESFTDGVGDPMPWSVFFEDGGIAFHSGNPNAGSSGCIHLDPEYAEKWFNFLEIGDQVQVVRASEEMEARGLPYDGPRPSTDNDSSADDDSDS